MLAYDPSHIKTRGFYSLGRKAEADWRFLASVIVQSGFKESSVCVMTYEAWARKTGVSHETLSSLVSTHQSERLKCLKEALCECFGVLKVLDGGDVSHLVEPSL